MKTLSELLTSYRHYHQQKNTQIAHYIAVPATLIGLFMLLSWVNLDFATVWKISFAWIIAAITLIYYYCLNVKLAAVTTVLMLIIVFFAGLLATPQPTAVSITLCLILFLGGCCTILISHHFLETEKLSYPDCLYQILIAPLFVVIALLDVLGISKYVLPPEITTEEKP